MSETPWYRRVWPWIVASLLALGGILLAVLGMRRPTPPPPSPTPTGDDGAREVAERDARARERAAEESARVEAVRDAPDASARGMEAEDLLRRRRRNRNR